jgi:uncharacterized protein
VPAPPEFDWDEHNERHLARHKISRSDVEDVLSGSHILVAFESVEGEERWTAVGTTRSGKILVIVFAIRNDSVRPVTGWVADEKTTKLYFEKMGHK